MLNLVWLQGSGDTGCSISFLNAHQPDVATLMTKFNVNLVFHPTLSSLSGPEVMELFDEYSNGEKPVDVLVVEGAIPLGPNGTGEYCVVGHRPIKDLVKAFAAKAQYVVAIGTCASFGGISAADPNPTEATGLQFYRNQKGGLLGADFKSAAGAPVVNIPGCPAHPDWVTETLSAVILGMGSVLELDEFQRPKSFFDTLAHWGCPKNEYYEFAVPAEDFGKNGCLVKDLGCKGIYTHADCNRRRWNGQSSKTTVGSPCLGCTEPNFPDASKGYFFRTDGWPAPLGANQFFRIPALGLLKMATPKRLKEEG